MTKKNIVYAGLDINTFFLLISEPEFHLVSVAYNEDLVVTSVNPVNHIGRQLYLRRKVNKSKFTESIFNLLWRLSNFASTGIFRRYRDYLTTLSTNQIGIIDLTDSSTPAFLRDNVDLLIVNAWGLLRGDIVNACKYGTFNVHPSLLPKYRGALPTLWALKNRDAQTAVTYMLIDESMDGGPIISQHIFDLDSDENWYSIESKVAKIVQNTFVDDVKKYLRGELVPQQQNEDQQSITGTYSKCRRIDWENEQGIDIYNKINLYPHLEYGLYCFFVVGSRKIYIKKANFSKIKSLSNSLKIHFRTIDGFIVCRPLFDLSLKDSLFCIVRLK